MEILMIGIITQGTVLTIAKSMVIFLKIAQEHILGNYNRWLNEIVCFSCLKTSHVSKNCLSRSPTSSNEFNIGNGKVDAEKVKMQMNKTWKKEEDCNTSNADEVTSSNGSSDHITPN